MNDNTVPEIVTQKSGSKNAQANVEKNKLDQKLRPFWIVVMLLSGLGLVVDIIFVTPEDFLPIIGWLDEGLLGTIFLFALDRLGIRIPLLSRLFGNKNKKTKKD